MAKKINEVMPVAMLADSEYVVVTLANGEVGRIKKSDLLSNIKIGDSTMIGYPCFSAGRSSFHNTGNVNVIMILLCTRSGVGGTCGRLFTTPASGYDFNSTYADIYIGVDYKLAAYTRISRMNNAIRVGMCLYGGKTYYCAYITGFTNDYKGQYVYFTGASSNLQVVPYNECVDFSEVTYV